MKTCHHNARARGGGAQAGLFVSLVCQRTTSQEASSHTAFASALSQLPKDNQGAALLGCARGHYTKVDALHATAAQPRERLFPNKQTYVPNNNEAEPSSDVEDDFDDSEEGLTAREAEYERATAVAGDLGVPRAPLRASWLGGVYRCRGLGAREGACAAAEEQMRVLILLGIRRTFMGRAAASTVLVM